MFTNILKKEKEIIINPNQTTTLQAYHTKVIGDIVGHDEVFIEGVVDGCVIVDNVVVVAKDAQIKGKIQAQTVIVEGEVRGRIECDFLKVKPDGLVLANVEAREINVAGKLQGEIVVYDLFLDENAYLGTKIQANQAKIRGTLVGEISCDRLFLDETSYVKGTIYSDDVSNLNATIKGEVKKYKKILSKRTNLCSSKDINKQILKDSIDKYIKNSEYINEILKQKVDINVKVNNLINYIKEHANNDEEILKVTRLINYSG